MVSPNVDQKVRISNDILFRELEGEAVLLNIQTGIYFGLDPLGTKIWQLFQKKYSIEEVSKSIRNDYEVDAQSCREDILNFTASLQKNGLIDVYEA